MIEFHLTHPDRGSRERNISSEKGEWCVRECVLRKSEGEMGGEGGGRKGRVELCWANLEEFLPHGAAN